MSEPGGPDGLPPLQPPGAGDAAPPPAPDGEAPGTGDEGEGGRPAVPRDKKNVQYAGRSVYIRKKIKTEDKDGQMKTKTFWVLEGRTLGDHDREFMWEERRAKDGSTQYRNAATGRSTRTLPDMGPTKSAIADPTEQLSPRRVKQQPMDGWNQDKKTAVQGHVRKLLSRQVKEGKIDPLSAEVQKILVKNVSDKHMSEHPPFDGELLPEATEKALQDETNAQLGAWLKERSEAIERAQAEAEMPDLSYLDGPPLDEEAALPDRPDKAPPEVQSPFLRRATYLRDPYYYMRLDYPNPRRSLLEEELENKLFFTPNMGEIKVVGAIEGWNCHPTDLRQNEPCIIAVVRDWVGACCLMYIQQPGPHLPEYSITATYPITEHVEFLSLSKHVAPKPGEPLRAYLGLDDQWHTVGVGSVDDQRYLELCLKLAMAMMYGQGADDKRIVDMRAHGVEFAWNHTAPIPQEAAMAKFDRLMNSTEEELEATGDAKKAVDALVHDLRLYMLAADKRDSLLRKWVAHVTRRRDPPPKTEQLLRQLRLVEEAIRYPAPSNDPFLADHVQKALAAVEMELVRSREAGGDEPGDAGTSWGTTPERLAKLWHILSQHSADYRSRDQLPDRPLERFFEPAPGSKAAEVQKRNIAQRHANFKERQLPSGIYLSALVYVGDTDATREILMDAHLNMPSEMIGLGQLTDEQIDSTGRESDNFRWVLEHGVDPNWAENIQVWSQLFDNSGTARFRSFFLDATRRLQKQLGRYDIGIVFDNVIVLEEVRCMHIITVLRLNRREDLPFISPLQQDWSWQPAIDAEYNTYLKGFLIRASTRVAFMPAGYNDCKRFLHAGMQYRESLDHRLEPGLYLGYFGCLPASQGFQVLTVASHRHLVPLAKVQAELPTLEQWRWVQCLNEKRRRLGSFEWHTISSKVRSSDRERALPTFRHRFLRAVLELQETTGRPVEHLYDLEIVSFDEARQVKVIAVVERFLVEPPPYTPPVGTAPCTWKQWEVAEAQYLQLYWPEAWAMFRAARSAADAAQRRVMQPFAADEALRLGQTGALLQHMEVERMFLPLRWFWTLWAWAGGGYQSVVAAYEGDVDRTIVRGIEESVEIAVSNYATQQDINHLTMKSLAMDAGKEVDWETLQAKLREIERTMKHGYAQRIHQPDTIRSEPVPQERTWDELYSDEGSDEEYNFARPPTTYELDCTIEEYVERDGADPSKYFAMQDIVREIVEASMIRSIDVGIVKACGDCVSDMIEVIETGDALCNDAVVLNLQEDAADMVMEERDNFQLSWLRVFQEGDVLEGAGSWHAGDGELSDDEDSDDGRPGPEIFTQGSSYAVGTVEEGIRVCMARAMGSVHQVESLLRVINSAQEVLELTDAVSEFDAAVAKQVAIIRGTVEPAGGAKSPGRGGGRRGGPPTATASLAALSPAPSVAQAPTPAAVSPPRPAGPSPAPAAPTSASPPRGQPQPPPHIQQQPDDAAGAAAALTVVSSDYREYRIPAVDPSRCLSLKSARGKIRFPAVHSSLLSVVAYFLSLPDAELAAFLSAAEETLDQAGVQPQALLGIATQLKSPLLTLRAAALLYGSPLIPPQDGLDRAISGEAAGQLKTALEGSFLMSFGVRDWLQWEALGGPAVAPVLDVLWWVRYLKEAAPAAGDAPPSYADYEQAWKQMYAETRIRVFLSRGVGQLQREEVALWNGAFGELVQYLTFRDRALTDEEMEVLTACCPNLRSLDVSGTGVTDRSAQLLMERCKSLGDVNADGSKVTPGMRKQLMDFAAANALRGTVALP